MDEALKELDDLALRVRQDHEEVLARLATIDAKLDELQTQLDQAQPPGWRRYVELRGRKHANG
jgi:5,10-methylenetetrahydrofolate reductase